MYLFIYVVSMQDKVPDSVIGMTSAAVNIPKINLIPNAGGGGGADSAHLQILFFIASMRDEAEPQTLATFTNFYLESREMTIFRKSPYHKVIKWHLHCHNF